jgi:hypothetical protein
MSTSLACPVKDLARSVQRFIDAAREADASSVALRSTAGSEALLEKKRQAFRHEALIELIGTRVDLALTTQAESPEGALHQLALSWHLVQRLWENSVDLEDDPEGLLEAKHAYEMLRWGMYSIARVLELLSAEQRDRLAVEFYMIKRGDPFEAAAPVESGAA